MNTLWGVSFLKLETHARDESSAKFLSLRISLSLSSEASLKRNAGCGLFPSAFTGPFTFPHLCFINNEVFQGRARHDCDEVKLRPSHKPCRAAGNF